MPIINYEDFPSQPTLFSPVEMVGPVDRPVTNDQTGFKNRSEPVVKVTTAYSFLIVFEYSTTTNK